MYCTATTIRGRHPQVDAEGQTALHSAVSHNEDPTYSRILIAAGCKPDQKTNWSLTPLVCAISEGRCEPIRILVENGADVNLIA